MLHIRFAIPFTSCEICYKMGTRNNHHHNNNNNWYYVKRYGRICSTWNMLWDMVPSSSSVITPIVSFILWLCHVWTRILARPKHATVYYYVLKIFHRYSTYLSFYLGPISIFLSTIIDYSEYLVCSHVYEGVVSDIPRGSAIGHFPRRPVLVSIDFDLRLKGGSRRVSRFSSPRARTLLCWST